MSDLTTIMLPDGTEIDLSDLDESELLELYRSYEEQDSLVSVGTVVGGGFTSTLDSCLGPTTWQTMLVAAKIFAMCFLLRVVTLMKIPNRIKHSVSCVTGIATFHMFFVDHQMLYHLFVFCSIGYLLMVLAGKFKGALVSLFCVTFLLSW